MQRLLHLRARAFINVVHLPRILRRVKKLKERVRVWIRNEIEIPILQIRKFSIEDRATKRLVVRESHTTPRVRCRVVD